MEAHRLFLFLALGILSLLLWNQWQTDYRQPVAQQQQAQQQPIDSQTGAPAPGGVAPSVAPSVGQAAPAAGQPAVAEQLVKVVTDTLEVLISTRGGELRQVRLLQYTEAVDNPNPTTLLTPEPPVFLAQSGLQAAQGSEAPSHNALFEAQAAEYRLAEGQQELVVPLRWRGADGVEVVKQYVFRRGEYDVRMTQQVSNGSEAPWQGFQYAQLRRQPPQKSGSIFFINTYTGGVIHTPENRYEKIDFDDMASRNLERDVRGGWIAMIQHYFLAAWAPAAESQNRFFTRNVDGQYVLGMSSQWATVAPGEQTTFANTLYVGPKDQKRLAALADGLDLTVDYGVLTIISKPLYWLLSKIHDVVGNWGWAIVILTLIIKLVFYKLSETSYRSMARMRTMQPKMQQLKERFGDDRQKLNQELMELYKREKINPLGGCLPILIQIPVFISLYWVLLESVELRQADFIFWIKDLSVQDPYYVLPILMGISMFLQQKLNPAPMDPVQQKVMTFLPIVFTVFFLFFPAGLVLYWVTNNVLSIAQQWVITRRIENLAAKKG
jgi:YidC/Oxa1 family membrane protein insertase